MSKHSAFSPILFTMLAFSFIGCSKHQPSYSLQKETTKPSSEDAQWQPPKYPHIEFYILTRDDNSPDGVSNQGCTGRDDLSLINKNSHLVSTQTWGESGKIPYKLSLEYLGRSKDDADRYEVEYSVPVGSQGASSVKQEMMFSGTNLVIFKNDKFVMGIRIAKTPSNIK
jgi:hypothetical protein